MDPLLGEVVLGVIHIISILCYFNHMHHIISREYAHKIDHSSLLRAPLQITLEVTCNIEIFVK